MRGAGRFPQGVRRYRAIGARGCALITMLIAVHAAACGGGDSSTAPEEEGPDFTAASIELLTDEVRPMGMLGVAFRARARGRNAAGEIIPLKLPAWSTDTPEILEVTPEGEVTSLSEGEGRVIARMDGIEAVMRLPVREVARLEWQRTLGGFGQASPAVGPDGTVYVPAFGTTLADGNQFWAFDASGTVRWSSSTPEAYQGPAVGAGGKLYVGSTNARSHEGELSAMGPDGTKLWRLPRPGQIGPPALGGDGTVYAVERDSAELVLLAAAPGAGELPWEYRIEGDPGPSAPPALALDNTAYFRTRDGVVHAVSVGGEPLWSLRLTGEFYGAPVVAADGAIYVGSKDGRFYAISPAGEVIWSLDFEGDLITSAAIGLGGTIYQLAGGVLHAISPDGGILWTWMMDSAFLRSASPVIGGDGTVYVGGGGRPGRVYAIEANGELKWDFSTANSVIAAPAIGLDGTIYVASMDSTLYAIRELDGGNGGFDASPWPVWRGNRQNTGRAGP